MQTLIAQLNKMALYHSEGEVIDLPAIRRAVNDFGLEFVATDDDGFEEQCHIYRAADGTLINCWIANPNRDGLGFDDQVIWFVDDLITQAEAAQLRGVTTQAIHQAIKDGRLRSYINSDAPKHQGRTLISRKDVEAM